MNRKDTRNTQRRTVHGLLACAATLLTASTTRAAQTIATARTDLASITLAPLARQTNAPTDWRTVYQYTGGDLPPGTRILADGKWLDPAVRRDASGVTYAFPALPDQPHAAQFLRTRFSIERPLANYPTRVTVKFTLFADQTANNPGVPWSVLSFTTSDLTSYNLFSLLSSDGVNPQGGNTVVFSFDGEGKSAVEVNGKPLGGNLAKRFQTKKAGALLLPGIALASGMTQLPRDKGDWFALNAVQIEQQRPDPEASAAAAVDLAVPGPAPVRVSLEVVDKNNTGLGFVLRDASVAPGRYRLYWEGAAEKSSQPQGSMPAGPGAYTFRLTTSKIQVRCLGEINNSAPKFNPESYAQVNCTALALTPPGTASPAKTLSSGFDTNRRLDTRQLDTTDSVQLVCSGYDSHFGQWIGADGSIFHTKTGDARLQNGRGVAVTPPDPADPGNLQKQYYFVSTSISSAQGVVSSSLPGGGKNLPKAFASPDWNRKSGAWPYRIRIGQIPELVGLQKFLYFKMGWRNGQTHADWVFRNVRLYEEGAPEPAPLSFDATRFSPRIPPGSKDSAEIVPPGTVIVENEGRAVHLKNAASVNYPLDYVITPRTVLAFELELIDRGDANFGAGIGLDSDPVAKNAMGYHGYFNFLPGDLRWGFQDPELGAYPYPSFQPNTLYTDSLPPAPSGVAAGLKTKFLFQAGYYGLKISEDGKLLFACNNADNRLEVRDIAGDGGALAKIPIDRPMYVTLAPANAAGAPDGVRYVYVDSPTAGLLRIAWRLADKTFGKPETLTPVAEFAYPRGLVYNAAAGRIFVCDSFTPDRARAANQILVIDPVSGKVLSRFGKPGGADPARGGVLGDDIFTCPLTIDADSHGALWVNDYYSDEVRKYSYTAATGGLTLERRVLGPNTTNISHFYWLPGAPPAQVWTVGDHLVRHEAELGADGLFTNQRGTAAHLQVVQGQLRPFAHFTSVSGHVYATFAGQGDVFEQAGAGWKRRFRFGTGAGEAARVAGLLAASGEAPTELDKAIAAAGDVRWTGRLWAWSDLNGDGKMQYSSANPEFKIAFNSDLVASWEGTASGGSLRDADGAYLYPTAKGLVAIAPRTVNGGLSYDWADAKVVAPAAGLPLVDAIARDGRFYTLRSSSRRHDVGAAIESALDAYDSSGHPLWSRGHTDYSLTSIEPVGAGLISTLERSFFNGLVSIRTAEGDLVCQVFCKEPGDCWSQGTLRTDADTAYIGYVQVYKVTGLTSIQSDTATLGIPVN